MPSRKAPNVKYFSICSKCQEEHAAGTKGDPKRNTPFQFSSDPADIKYDIISHALDELDAAKWTGINLTREHITRTWRAKVVNECGSKSGCAKMLLFQDSVLEYFSQESAQQVHGQDLKRPKKQTAAEPKIKTEIAAGTDGRFVKDAALVGKSEFIPATVSGERASGPRSIVVAPVPGSSITVNRYYRIALSQTNRYRLPTCPFHLHQHQLMPGGSMRNGVQRAPLGRHVGQTTVSMKPTA